MTRKLKGPSDEDRALFKEALADAKPLKTRRRILPDQDKPKIKFVPPEIFVRPMADGERTAPVIGGHTNAHLRRGRLEPESRLDLHGMSQENAYAALARFLTRAQADGMKLVLVITGKGGVLRDRFKFWLGQTEFAGLVSGVAEAHVRHGGAGAHYVTLRGSGRGR